MINRIDLPYGHTTLSAHLPEAEYCLLVPQRSPAAADTRAAASAALQNPIDSPRLRDMARAGESIAIAVPDTTRPCPTRDLLPPLLSELSQAGVKDEDVVIVSGLGSHRAQTDEERARLVGEDVFRRFRCIDSDPNDVVFLGRTRRGTPVEVFTPVVQADRRICVGNLEYHYFAGYSGGYKALAPGVCSVRTIEANHSWMVAPGAQTGQIEGNPVREDIDEAGARVGADFILNVILDEDHRAVSAVAGHPVAAHRAGCRQLNAFGRASLPWPADVVLVSAGGFPKDINLYQAQKALDNARVAVRPGGTIILVAECPEGLGHGVFGEWMLSGQTPDQLIARIRQRFVLGGHKAAAIALAQKRATLALVSSLPAEQCRAMGFVPYASPAEALGAALAGRPAPARVALMPRGGSVLPVVDTVLEPER